MPHSEPKPAQASDAQEAGGRAREAGASPRRGYRCLGRWPRGIRAVPPGLPPDSGLAYVLVQHLSPEHESSLAEILARATNLPVEIARDGQRIERDHVYVIPPGTGLLVEDGALRLVSRSRRAAACR